MDSIGIDQRRQYASRPDTDELDRLATAFLPHFRPQPCFRGAPRRPQSEKREKDEKSGMQIRPGSRERRQRPDQPASVPPVVVHHPNRGGQKQERKEMWAGVKVNRRRAGG